MYVLQACWSDFIDIATDITIRAIGKRAHPLHNVTYVSFLSVIASGFG